jgi:hypothetical protein
LQDSLIKAIDKKGGLSVDLSSISKKATLVKGSSVSWNVEALETLLKKKGLKKIERDSILVENTIVTVDVNEKNLDKLRKSKIISMKDIKSVSRVTPRKPFLRFFNLENDDG